MGELSLGQTNQNTRVPVCMYVCIQAKYIIYTKSSSSVNIVLLLSQ